MWKVFVYMSSYKFSYVDYVKWNTLTFIELIYVSMWCKQKTTNTFLNSWFSYFETLQESMLIRENAFFIDNRQIGSGFFVDGIGSKNKGFIE